MFVAKERTDAGCEHGLYALIETRDQQGLVVFRLVAARELIDFAHDVAHDVGGWNSADVRQREGELVRVVHRAIGRLAVGDAIRVEHDAIAGSQHQLGTRNVAQLVPDQAHRGIDR